MDAESNEHQGQPEAKIFEKLYLYAKDDELIGILLKTIDNSAEKIYDAINQAVKATKAKQIAKNYEIVVGLYVFLKNA